MISVTKPPAALGLFHPITLLSTWFGCGLMRPASGTWGSAGALPFAWVIVLLGGPISLAVAAVLCLAIGIWSSGRYAAASGISDPGQVVIDEVAGQWVTLSFLPLDPVWYAAGFFAFRVFDIVKPFPAGWCDKNLKGGFGIMIDDIFAGIYAGLLVWGAVAWLG